MTDDTPQYESATLGRGLRGNLRYYIERVSGRRALLPYLWQGLVLTLLGWLPTVAGSVLRGLIYRTVLAGAGPGCFQSRQIDT